MQKPMFAAFLALASLVGFTAVANAEVTHSYPRYYVNSVNTGAPAVITQPAVIQQSAVIQGAGAVACPTVTTGAATACPALGTMMLPAQSATVLTQPAIVQQTLIQPAIVKPAGFTMDPAALRLYCGPRLENTLTMPDGNTFLRN